MSNLRPTIGGGAFKRGQSLLIKGDCPLYCVGVMLLVALLVLSGCSRSRPSPHMKMRAGMFVEARDLVESQVEDDRDDRRFMLDRMRAGVLNLDVGDPVRAERWFAEVYDVLRTQGLNDDKTVSSVVLTEGVKIWKGEPFEQAMALVYYGFVQAQMGSWDNARAAAGNALFYLRDFSDVGTDESATKIDTTELARRARAHESQQRGDGQVGYDSPEAYLEKGYIAERNNFTMAYLLHGIASHQLGRFDEASDYLNRALALNPSLGPLVQTISAGDYNTIVVVADGLGPRKVAVGPNGSLSRYRPLDLRTEPATITYAGQPAMVLPMVTNVNTMALDHRWNNLEDVRIAKSVIGDIAFVGGAFTLSHALNEGDGVLAIIGASLAAIGLAFKATAKANTDYCDVFPQRLFVAALNVTEPGHALFVDTPSYWAKSGVTLRNLPVPRGPEAAFYYLRAPMDREVGAPPPPPPNPTQALGPTPALHR